MKVSALSKQSGCKAADLQQSPELMTLELIVLDHGYVPPGPVRRTLLHAKSYKWCRTGN